MLQQAEMQQQLPNMEFADLMPKCGTYGARLCRQALVIFSGRRGTTAALLRCGPPEGIRHMDAAVTASYRSAGNGARLYKPYSPKQLSNLQAPGQSLEPEFTPPKPEKSPKALTLKLPLEIRPSRRRPREAKFCVAQITVLWESIHATWSRRWR